MKNSPVRLESLATGEIMPRKLDKSIAFSPSHRIVVNRSRASLNTSLELTTVLLHEDSCSQGSTASGDSCVLAIDWNDADICRNNDTFNVVPFLRHTFDNRVHLAEAMDEHQRGKDDFPRSTVRKRMESWSVRPSLIRIPSLSSTPASAKSLGSFSFPSNDDLTLRALPCATSAKSLGSFTFPTDLALEFDVPTQPLLLSADRGSGFDDSNKDSCPSHRVSFARMKQYRERSYWKHMFLRQMIAGPHSLKTAESGLHLGWAHHQAGELCQAEAAFQISYRIYHRQRKRLGMAQALEGAGLAGSRVDAMDAADRGMDHLEEALRIRLEELGPTHVDTVQVMNHLGQVHFNAANFSQAHHCYWEVFCVRKMVFGPNHPSVAVAAHDLAKVTESLSALPDAANFYNIAMEIYEIMGLPDSNPAVARLLSDARRLERLQQFTCT
ncbi:predicted protein [Phaeodactylum tricornutum CCAP 1055/1]|jgi:tetratricopeptide (TPR) repeat protein|uniref:Kinesin light chain n=2 Tax=Phaeodactylum tricornutum TaxID=2850 RepID=B7G8C6_PHATC|nr:predicted protein [Phaeodactylum tricornutum CCAP 1055/1]EEC45022.1 predicted protein [Phaeodactylum tricornutum CCAP 1055/1]|eukprot:XP_002183322.1 predicted protein [Phaeodactylum tricornutum CCAP 1055/1]